jgi:hypothetical protein
VPSTAAAIMDRFLARRAWCPLALFLILGQTKRGKRKLGTASAKAPTAKVSLAPEEVFYEGPPAISETIVPTASILTVIGVIPAAAAWARQAWVRYRITTRRIRCTSGIGGKVSDRSDNASSLEPSSVASSSPPF